MDKPEWKDAPEWATHLAMDADGQWWWYQHTPKWTQDREAWDLTSPGICMPARHRWCIVKAAIQSLEERP